MFKTCCALHNRLLFLDGLTNYQSATEYESDCMNNLGFSDADGAFNNITPMSRVQIFCHSEGIEEEDITKVCDTYPVSSFRSCTTNGIRVVKLMTLELFCECLVEHFDIMFRQHKIVWPKVIRN